MMMKRTKLGKRERGWHEDRPVCIVTGSRDKYDTAPTIFNPEKLPVSVARRLDGLQNRSGRGSKEETKLILLPEI